MIKKVVANIWQCSINCVRRKIFKKRPKSVRQVKRIENLKFRKFSARQKILMAFRGRQIRK